MGKVIDNSRRDVIVRPGLLALVEGVDFIPERVMRGDTSAARKLLERDGALILTGWPVEADSVVTAAATILGSRLRELEKVEERTTHSHEALALHRDGANVVVDIHDRLVHLRNPDVDYVAILCAAPARKGAESVVIDGYRLIERIRDGAPELYEFLTTVDVDVTSGIPRADVRRLPRVCRLVEWTRGGRMIVRAAEYTQPVPRETRWDEHQRQIDAYAEVLAALAAQVRGDTTLAAGEVLVLDNYRCLHGVRAHEGSRTVHVLRCKTQDAW